MCNYDGTLGTAKKKLYSNGDEAFNYNKYFKYYKNNPNSLVNARILTLHQK